MNHMHAKKMDGNLRRQSLVNVVYWCKPADTDIKAPTGELKSSASILSS